MGKGFDQLRAAAAEARARSMDAAERERLRRAAQAKLDEGYRAAGETAVGAAAGGAVRRFGAIASQVPMMSYQADDLRERNGVRVLTELARADRTNPMLHLWLAEAMAAMAKQKAVLDAARTLASPPMIAVRAVARIGVDRSDPVALMFKRAHGLAIARLRADKRDSEALHVVARVQLARSQPDKAVTPARLAATAGSGFTRGAAFATLASSYLALGQHNMARKAATAAIKSDCSIGWETIAALAQRSGEADEGQGGVSRKIAQLRKAETARSLVTDDDRLRYRGFTRPGEVDIARAALAIQGTKFRDGLSQVKRGLGRFAPKEEGERDP